MIKVDSELQRCVIDGDGIQIVSELASAISAVRETFRETLGDEITDRLIALTGAYAYATGNDKEMQDLAKQIADAFNEAAGEG